MILNRKTKTRVNNFYIYPIHPWAMMNLKNLLLNSKAKDTAYGMRSLLNRSSEDQKTVPNLIIAKDENDLGNRLLKTTSKNQLFESFCGTVKSDLYGILYPPVLLKNVDESVVIKEENYLASSSLG